MTMSQSDCAMRIFSPRKKRSLLPEHTEQSELALLEAIFD